VETARTGNRGCGPCESEYDDGMRLKSRKVRTAGRCGPSEHASAE